MKTNKYNNMIDAFASDFQQVVSGNHKLAELDERIEDGSKRILHDIDLLDELAWMLRNGQAEIHIVDYFAE